MYRKGLQFIIIVILASLMIPVQAQNIIEPQDGLWRETWENTGRTYCNDRNYYFDPYNEDLELAYNGYRSINIIYQTTGNEHTFVFLEPGSYSRVEEGRRGMITYVLELVSSERIDMTAIFEAFNGTCVRRIHATWRYIGEGSSVASSYQSGNLNHRLDANFGSVRLRAGFTPDPYRVRVTAGGPVSVLYVTAGATSTGNECTGYASSAPDYKLNWSGRSGRLEFDFDGDGDTVMIIRTPDGDWYCNDDGGRSYNPEITFRNPDTGTYAIWIASYNRGRHYDGVLEISEFAD